MFKVNSFAGAGRSEPKDCGLKQLVYKFIDKKYAYEENSYY